MFAAALCFSLHGAIAEGAPRKAQACVACHGPGGNSTDPAMPSLAGQPAQFISMQLFMFREGNRKDPQMSPMASSLSNADMNELAAYFSRQKPAAASHETASENAAAGRRLSEQHHCVQCHGPALLGLQHIPRLAGQQFAYLRTQLRGFKDKTRSEEHTSELQSPCNLVCRLLLEKKKKKKNSRHQEKSHVSDRHIR